MFGVPALVDSKGEAQANATLNLLEAWDLSDNLAALDQHQCIHNGAAKLIKGNLDQKLLYLAC